MFWHHTSLATSSCLTRSRSALWGSSKVSDSEVFLLTVAEVERMFWLEPLQLRRTRNDHMFLFNLVGYIDCRPGLLQVIIVSTVPKGKHSRSAFQGRFRLTNNYSLNSGISKLLRSGGAMASSVDFFHMAPLHNSECEYLRYTAISGFCTSLTDGALPSYRMPLCFTI